MNVWKWVQTLTEDWKEVCETLVRGTGVWELENEPRGLSLDGRLWQVVDVTSSEMPSPPSVDGGGSVSQQQ